VERTLRRSALAADQRNYDKTRLIASFNLGPAN
jgi:hypothetical protein